MLWSFPASVSTLGSVLRDPVCILFFQQYLVEVRAVEYILFWVEVALYRDLPGEGHRAKEARRLYNKYLAQGAQLEVPALGHLEREDVCDQLQAGLARPDLFDALQQRAFDVLRRDHFPGFQRSALHGKLVADLREQEEIYTRLVNSQLIAVDDDV